MKQTLTGWVMAASVAASVGLAQPGTAVAAATFVDAAAWHAAAAEVRGFTVQTMPAIAPERITMRDAWGQWTLADQEATFVRVEMDGMTYLRSRNYMFPAHPALPAWARSEPGEMLATFGCHMSFFPCLGMQFVEFDLKTPIIGFAGTLDYYWGYQESISNGIREGFITYFDGLEGQIFQQPWYSGRYWGFYGVIFDRPVSSLRFAWREDSDTDDSAYFHFRNMVAIGVPVAEPSLFATFAGALLLLLSLAGRREATLLLLRPAPPPRLWRRGAPSR